MPGSRDSEVRAAIEDVLRRVPEHQRPQLRAILEDPNVGFAASTHPEIARALTVIASIRAADVMADPRVKELARERERPASEAIRVTVALVPHLPQSNARAVVIREPGDRGIPLLLLPEDDASGIDMARGLRAAALALERYGAAVTRRAVVAVRARGGPDRKGLNIEGAERQLAHLRQSARRMIPGIGQVRAIDIGTRR